MARILIAWELGGGLGHAAVFAPLVNELRQRGHEMIVVARDPAAAATLLDPGIELIQGPHRDGSGPRYVARSTRFEHILANAGFADCRELSSLAGRWLELLKHFDPHVLIADHAPTALLASRSRLLRRVLLGTGFCCPPVHSGDLPELLLPGSPPVCPSPTVHPHQLLPHAVDFLAASGGKPLQSLGQLYSQTDRTLLATFPELDHFADCPGQRTNAIWLGTWSATYSSGLTWGGAPGPRLFAYLKPSPYLQPLLRALRQTPWNCLVACPGAEPELAEDSPRFRLSLTPVDIHAAADACDAALLAGGHGTVAELLLAGKPLVLMPQVVEQFMLGARIAQRKAALMVPERAAPRVIEALDLALHHPEMRAAARAFTACHASHDSRAAVRRAADAIEGCLGSPQQQRLPRQ